CLPFKAERVANAVARNLRRVAALLGASDGGRNINAQPEIRGLDRSHKVLSGDSVIKHSGNRCRRVHSINYRAEIWRRLTMPVRGRVHAARGAERASVNGISKIDGLERQSHFQKLLQLRNAALVVFATAGNGKDDVIVVKALCVTVSM